MYMCVIILNPKFVHQKNRKEVLVAESHVHESMYTYVQLQSISTNSTYSRFVLIVQLITLLSTD
jgi:hypothetical protein